MANAAERGEQLKQGLLRLRQRQFPEVGDVRGLGLMVAMDIVKARDPYTLRPGAARRRSCRRRSSSGLLLLGCGESAVRFCPPLCITAEQVETAPSPAGRRAGDRL